MQKLLILSLKTWFLALWAGVFDASVANSSWQVSLRIMGPEWYGKTTLWSNWRKLKRVWLGFG